MLIGSCQPGELTLIADGTSTEDNYSNFFIEKIFTSTGLVTVNVSTTSLTSVAFQMVIAGKIPPFPYFNLSLRHSLLLSPLFPSSPSPLPQLVPCLKMPLL